MPNSDVFNYCTVTWQDLFGRVLQDHLGVRGFRVTTNKAFESQWERPAGEWVRRQLAERQKDGIPEQGMPEGFFTLLIEQVYEPDQSFFPDGLDFLRKHNVMVFSGDVLTMGDLENLVAFAHRYANHRGLNNASMELGLLAGAPRFSEEVRSSLAAREVLPGVFEHHVENAPSLHIVETRQVIDIPENLLWKLFSFDPPKVRYALAHYTVNDDRYREVVDAVHDRMVAERLLG